MDEEVLIAAVRASLAAITSARFFETERGYQGALLVELHKRLDLKDQKIVEQEYQKNMREHGLDIRPDIIIHEPFETGRYAARTEGNIAVMELKVKASKKEASDDIDSLRQMIEVLNYPIGFFINIASVKTCAELVPDAMKDHIVCLAVSLKDGKTEVIGGQ